MSRGAIVVEFVGLPGAGKTTLCRELARLLRQEGLQVSEPMLDVSGSPRRSVRALRKTAIVLREAWMSPLRTLSAGRAIARTRQRSWLEALSQWFNWELVTGLLRVCRRQSGLHLFDQGAFQALWSIRFGAAQGTTETLARTLLPGVSLPRLVVVVESELGAIEARLVHRKDADSRIEREHVQIRSQWPRLIRLLEENVGVIRSCSAYGACDVEVIDNGEHGSVERSARFLAEAARARTPDYRPVRERALRAGTTGRA